MEQTRKKRTWKGFFGHIGRRNLIILSVMLLIGLAVYLNYLWFYNPADYTATPASQMTDTTPVEEVDYFASAVLKRETVRSESVETLNAVVEASEGAEREEALATIARIAKEAEDEGKIETLVRAGGYQQCVAVISGDTASIVVSGENPLDASRVAAITEIAYEQAGILPVNLTVKQK